MIEFRNKGDNFVKTLLTFFVIRRILIPDFKSEFSFNSCFALICLLLIPISYLSLSIFLSLSLFLFFYLSHSLSLSHILHISLYVFSLFCLYRSHVSLPCFFYISLFDHYNNFIYLLFLSPFLFSFCLNLF